jgi:hypothetical protein
LIWCRRGGGPRSSLTSLSEPLVALARRADVRDRAGR